MGSDKKPDGIEGFNSDVVRLKVQLAGCSVVALGDVECCRESYGWSPALEDVKKLRLDYEKLRGQVDRLESDLWLEFVLPGSSMCGLCNDGGQITGMVYSPSGVEVGVKGFCICPNGRKLKNISEESSDGQEN